MNDMSPSSASVPAAPPTEAGTISVEKAHEVAQAILDEVCRAVVGKRDVVRLILACLLYTSDAADE